MQKNSQVRVQHNQPETLEQVEHYDGLSRLIQTKKRAASDNQFVVAGHTEYNSRGLPEKKYLPKSTTLGMSEIDPIDQAHPHSTIEYDAMGRVVKTTSPDGTYSNVEYDDWTLTAYDANGHMQKSYFDAYKQLIKKEEYD